MRQLARLSSAVPHSTAFLPPAFMAMLPPMHEASVAGRVHRKHKACALGRIGHALGHHAGFGPHGGHLLVQDPAGGTISTSVMASSFSVLMTTLFQVSGIAPPV